MCRIVFYVHQGMCTNIRNKNLAADAQLISWAASELLLSVRSSTQLTGNTDGVPATAEKHLAAYMPSIRKVTVLAYSHWYRLHCVDLVP